MVLLTVARIAGGRKQCNSLKAADNTGTVSCLQHCVKNCYKGQQIAPVQRATGANVVEAILGAVVGAVVGVAVAIVAVSGHLLPQ